VAYPDCSVVLVDDEKACAIKFVRNRSDGYLSSPLSAIILRQLGDSESGIYCQPSDIRDVNWHCSG
jgi:hypothetical protein